MKTGRRFLGVLWKLAMAQLWTCGLKGSYTARNSTRDCGWGDRFRGRIAAPVSFGLLRPSWRIAPSGGLLVRFQIDRIWNTMTRFNFVHRFAHHARKESNRTWEFQKKENRGYLDHHQHLDLHGHGLHFGHLADWRHGSVHLGGHPGGHLGHDSRHDSVFALWVFPHLEGREVEPYFLYPT